MILTPHRSTHRLSRAARMALLWSLTAFLAACGGDAAPGGSVFLRGAVEKGPFIVGASVSIDVLDATGRPTGSVLNTTTFDDLGNFNLSVPGGAPLRFEATGGFYNEATGMLSSSALTLRAYYLPDGSATPSAYINVITHLTARRIERLTAEGASFGAAVEQSEFELRAALRIIPESIVLTRRATETTVAGTDDVDNAWLLAVSTVVAQAAILRTPTSPDIGLQELINALALDLEGDGEIGPTLGTWIDQALDAVDSDAVETALRTRLALLGRSDSNIDLDAVLDQDRDGVVNRDDNCRFVANANQADVDANGLGDACESVYVKASNTDADDNFGLSVALSADGATLAVGAPGEASSATGVGGDQSSNAADSSGAVYVFWRSAGGVWTQEAYLKASNTGANHQFGRSVALSADGATLAVGANQEYSPATGVGGDEASVATPGSGAVYVFRRSADGAWEREAYVKASNTGEFDAFGTAVALSGDRATLAVGAPGEASSATGVGGDQASDAEHHSGAVYVFRRSAGGVWAQQAYVKASNSNQDDEFGWSIALSADGATLAVGAHREASAATGLGGEQLDNSLRGAGAVYLFRQDAGGAWAQEAYVKASNTDADDAFGESVALAADGATLAVGANQEDSAATGVGGDQSSNASAASGAVYVFRRSAGGEWAQEAYVKASNTATSDFFGTSVAVSADGAALAVGAFQEDSAATGVRGDQASNAARDSGAVYVFRRSAGGAWAQGAYVKASNTDADDVFGYSVGLR